MNIDRLIGILGLAAGIPAILDLFIKKQYLNAAFILLLLGAIVYHFIDRWYQDKKPMFTVLSLEKKTVISEPHGKTATFRREEKFRTNHKGMESWWCRNIGVSGSISNLQIDGGPPDVMRNGTAPGLIEICKYFPNPLPKGYEGTTVLTYDMADSFTQSREQVVHSNMTHILQLAMIVELPRPCTKAELHLTFGGQNANPLKVLEISEDRKTLLAKIKRPTLGAQYHISWTW